MGIRMTSGINHVVNKPITIGEKLTKFRLTDEAIAKSEEALLNQIMRMAITRDDWRAPAWILERRFPERWSAKQELKVETNQTSNGTEEVLSMLEQIKNNPSQPQEKILQSETVKGDST